jgi:ribose transport system substrate-binding protein
MKLDALAPRQRGRGAPRRVSALAVAIALPALGLAACGSSSNSSSSAAATSSSAAAASTSSSASAVPVSSSGSRPSWCGTKPITLGIQDGGGLNAWSQESLRQVKLEAAKCPAVKKEIVVDAGFDLQKAISGMTGLVAQGANAIVIIPDAGGPAELPGIRQATAHGVKVVPWGSNPGGTAGSDYASYVDWNTKAAGVTWAGWLFKTMGGKGNVLYLGGPAGNAVDTGVLSGVSQVLKQYPNIHMLTGTSTWPVTNWDPAQAQTVMSGLLSKYPTINGILMGDGQSSASVVKVLEGAGRKVPPIATLEANQIGCTWKDAQGTKDAFPLATISGRNWMGRIAVRKAVAAASGLSDNEKSIISLPLYENSEAGGSMNPHCAPSKSPGTYLSNYQPDSVLNALSGYSGQ